MGRSLRRPFGVLATSSTSGSSRDVAYVLLYGEYQLNRSLVRSERLSV